MKSITKRLPLLLALAMLFALLVPLNALAAETTDNQNTTPHTITIKNEVSGHTYEAYQVFAGGILEVEKDGQTSSQLGITGWGSGVKGDELLSALKKLEIASETPFKDCTDAKSVAAVVAGWLSEDNTDKLDAFAEVVGANLDTSSAAPTSTQSDNTDEDKASYPYKYTIKVDGDGYYFVKDKDKSITDKTADAYTKYILRVIADTTINAKDEVPTIDKVIVDNSKETKTNEASIGDTVSYKITSKVPAMDGYNKYFYIVTDTLSKGLTYDAEKASLTVKIGDTTLAKNDTLTANDTKAYTATVTSNQDGTTTLEIVFGNFIQYKTADYMGKDIVITYDATLNENAVVGTAGGFETGGNPNKVALTYANNPNVTYTGDNANPDKPKEDEPTGVTPESKVVTYTTELQISKVDESKNALTGAAFRLTGENVNKVLVSTGSVFEADNNGAYYKLKDGQYTQTAPTDDTKKNYADGTTKYKLTTSKLISTDKENNVYAEAYVDSSGKLTFTGLGAGTYKLEEIVTPPGYNTIDPIEFTVSYQATATQANPVPAFTVTMSDSNLNTEQSIAVDTANGNEGKLTTTIINTTGYILPGTGGIGTTIFYIVGGVLLVGAGVLLITKKRMDRGE